MREGKPPLKKNFQIKLTFTIVRINFPKRLPYPDKYSLGISFEYLSGWLELTEEKMIRLCLCHTIFINS